jgi:hypothetical protein
MQVAKCVLKLSSKKVISEFQGAEASSEKEIGQARSTGLVIPEVSAEIDEKDFPAC